MIRIINTISAQGKCTDWIIPPPWQEPMHNTSPVLVFIEHTKQSCLVWTLYPAHFTPLLSGHNTFQLMPPFMKKELCPNLKICCIRSKDEGDEKNSGTLQLHPRLMQQSKKYIEIWTPSHHNIYTLGITGHFFLPNAPMINKSLTTNPQCITLPNGYTIASTHTGHFKHTLALFEGPYCPFCAWWYTFNTHLSQTILWCWLQSRIWCHQLLCCRQEQNNPTMTSDKRIKLWTFYLKNNPTPNPWIDNKILKFWPNHNFTNNEKNKYWMNWKSKMSNPQSTSPTC